jgi:hypothetical protein
MSAPDPFNSVGGYTVGIPPLPIIAANGDITAGNISGDNLSITSDIHAGGNIYGSHFYGIFEGAISGGLTVPGLSTQVLYNTNGTADASQNFTFNSSTNTLAIRNGIITTDTFTLGVGSKETSSTTIYQAVTSSITADQILITTDSTTVCGLDFTIIATNSVDHRRQASKIMATVMNGEVGYYEYGTINVPISSPGVADFKVSMEGGNVNLTVTPLSTSVTYKIITTRYKE